MRCARCDLYTVALQYILANGLRHWSHTAPPEIKCPACVAEDARQPKNVEPRQEPTIDTAFRLVKRIRACDGEAAGVAALVMYLRAWHLISESALGEEHPREGKPALPLGHEFTPCNATHEHLSNLGIEKYGCHFWDEKRNAYCGRSEFAHREGKPAQEQGGGR